MMYNITVGRLPEDPEAQGVIKPDDDSWQLVIDKNGVPHLWVSTNAENADGTTTRGKVPIDMFLQEGVTVHDIMHSTFGGELTDPAEIAEAEADYERVKAEHGLPCPR